MKSAIAILATVFAVSAFAQAPAKKEEVKPVPAVTAPAAPHKADTKPHKSDKKSDKKDAPKADTKPAVPAK